MGFRNEHTTNFVSSVHSLASYILHFVLSAYIRDESTFI